MKPGHQPAMYSGKSSGSNLQYKEIADEHVAGMDSQFNNSPEKPHTHSNGLDGITPTNSIQLSNSSMQDLPAPSSNLNSSPSVNVQASNLNISYASSSSTHLSSSNSAVYPITSPDGGPSSLPPAQLDVKVLLKRQIEYYFSRENLNHDMYLLSQMDSDQYVSLNVIARFNQVRRLTSSMELILEALADSEVLQVDTENLKVRPCLKRNVLILRDLPVGTTQEEIESIMTNDQCPVFEYCELAHQDCWYVYYASEKETEKAYEYIRYQTYKGNPIKARFKAKSYSAINSRDQRFNGMPSQSVDNTRPPNPALIPQQQSALRYPLPMPPFSVPAPALTLPQTPYPFMFLQPFMQQWNTPGVYPADPNQFGYDINGFTYSAMPAHSRPGLGNANRHQGERRNHSRASSNASDRGSDMLHQSASQPTATTNTAPKNSSNSHYFNGRSQNETTGYLKQHNGDKQGNQRGRGHHNHHSANDQYYSHPDNIPPRHRDASQGYRLHKQRISSGHGSGQFSQGLHLQSQPAPPRRPVSHHSRGGNSVFGQSNGHSSSIHARSNMAGHNQDNRVDRNGHNRQHADHHNSHPRPHGAHRNSKSPDHSVEQLSSGEPPQSETFELDSSAFPALPGAMAVAATADASGATSQPLSDVNSSAAHTDASTPNSSQSANANTQITNSAEGTKSGSVQAAATEQTVNTESVAKLSDIVKNKIPEGAKLSDIVKGVNKLTVVSSAAHVKDSSEKLHTSFTTSRHSNTISKSQSNAAHHKARPTHLPNGIHTGTDSITKHIPKGKSSTSKTVDANVPKALSESSKSQSSSKEEVSAHPSEPKSSLSLQPSPTDKVSYAAIAQRTSAAQKTSPSQDQIPATSQLNSSSGDNNNNAENKPVSPTKPDNPHSCAAAKNMPTTSITQSSQRKHTFSQHAGSAVKKQRDNNPVSSPVSPSKGNKTAQPAVLSSAVGSVVAR